MKKNNLTTGQNIKRIIWKGLYPIFPWLQKHFLKWHLVWHEKGRQPYRIGWLAPGKTLEELEKHLHDKWGFGNHFVAWSDNGQILSWRKLESFDFQDSLIEIKYKDKSSYQLRYLTTKNRNIHINRECTTIATQTTIKAFKHLEKYYFENENNILVSQSIDGDDISRKLRNFCIKNALYLNLFNNEELYQKLSAQALQRARRDFPVEKAVMLYEEIYQQVCQTT